MPFDTLPDELLEEIFSHLGGKQRMDLSLVNRHWFRILSTPRFTQAVKLRLNKQRAGCIPIDVIFHSKREYQHICCSITDESDIFVQLILGDLLQQCAQRWNVQSLEIDAYYGRLLLFLQVNRHLLEGLRALFIKVENSRRHEALSHGVPIDDHLVLQLNNLELLHWNYGASNDDHHILSFVTPQLKRLEMCQFFIQPQFLDSITVVRTSMAICSTLRNLQELYLCGLYFKPGPFHLELPHVRKLTLESFVTRGSLLVDAPSLVKLTTDCESLNALRLSNASTFHHVEFHLCRDCHQICKGMIRPDFMAHFYENYAHQVTELTLISHVADTPFEKFSLMLDFFAKIESLHLHQFSLPCSMDQQGPLLKKILITHCSTQARALSFPAQTECVTVYQLQGRRGDIFIFPVNMNQPRLESVDMPGRWYPLTARTIHSTRGFRYQAKEDGGGYPSMEFRNHSHKHLIPDHGVGGPEVEIVSDQYLNISR